MIGESNLATIHPTSDERTMAALAHFFGLIGSIIIYILQKDKSRFVRFQAAQAMVFDLMVMLLMFVLFFCIFSVMFFGVFATMFASLNNTTQSDYLSWLVAFPTVFPFMMVMCIFPFSLPIFVARIVATISVLNGNNFHYPWLGMKVEDFLTD